jgi:NAD(P)-dependent dehydrogenase (short-subunit alcohol dehydrogenase family)
LQNEIKDLNVSANCQFIACDINDKSRLIQEIQAILKDNSGPDILVNNAGIFAIDSVMNNDKKIWDDTLAVHLTAAYELACYVSQFMIKKRWGRIINVSSISAQGEAYALSYSAAKAGLIGLTRSLALELAKFSITVNAICPGWVETDMAINQLNNKQWCAAHDIDPAQSLDIARFSSPQDRLIEPDEIAGLTAFLCSQEAKGITGQSINICGGLSLT